MNYPPGKPSIQFEPCQSQNLDCGDGAFGCGMAMLLAIVFVLIAFKVHGVEVRRPETPADSPLTAKSIALGQQLAFDKRLSADGTVSCMSCHKPEHGYSDERSVSIGIGGKTGSRHSPTLINAAYLPQRSLGLFWDLHAAGLESQAKFPIENPKEMGQQTIQQVAKRIDAILGYHNEFAEIYGTGCTPTTLVQAISSFERVIVVNDTPMQRYSRGDQRAMNRQQLAGLAVFVRSGCLKCHSGPELNEDAAFVDSLTGRIVHQVGAHNIGVSVQVRDPQTGRVSNDVGAGSTFGAAKNFTWKTPSLICVGRHAPYGHAGQFPTLESFVEFLANPPRVKGVEIAAQNWTVDDKRNLVSFLDKGLDSASLPIFTQPALP